MPYQELVYLSALDPYPELYSVQHHVNIYSTLEWSTRQFELIEHELYCCSFRVGESTRLRDLYTVKYSRVYITHYYIIIFGVVEYGGLAFRSEIQTSPERLQWKRYWEAEIA